MPAEHAVRGIDPVWTVHAPEHVAFQVRPAGPMARGKAFLIDLIIRLVGFVALTFVIVLLSAVSGGGAGAAGLILLAWFVTEWGYHFLFEWKRAGATPGKRAAGIRVVDSQGMPIGAGASALRNLLRAADWMPFGYAVGLVTMVCSGGFRRLGDLAAGTVVVYEADHHRGARTPKDDPKVLELVRALPRTVATSLPGKTARALAAYIARRHQFAPPRRAEMARRLAPQLASYLGLQAPRDPDRFLCAIDLITRRGIDAQGRPLRGASFDRKAERAGAGAVSMVEGHRPHWGKLERLLQISPRQIQPQHCVDMAHLYRSVCADLALAEAYLLPERTRAYLDDLVARAHRRLYREQGHSLQRFAEVVFFQAPAQLYEDRCLRVAAVAFFGVFAFAILLAVLDPTLPAAVVGQGQIDQLKQMYADAPRGRAAGVNAGMTGFYIQNNVSIALTSFATGIFLGFGSLITLAFNGMVLGLVFGYMITAPPDIRAHFFEFVTAHGPFELTGIMLCGAAGLRLGWGMVEGGGLPLGQALQASARRAVPIVAAGALMVALAAPIEGFVSPSSLPLWGKRAVMVVCTLAVFGYLVVLGRLASRRRRRWDEEITGEDDDGRA